MGSYIELLDWTLHHHLQKMLFMLVRLGIALSLLSVLFVESLQAQQFEPGLYLGANTGIISYTGRDRLQSDQVFEYTGIPVGLTADLVRSTHTLGADFRYWSGRAEAPNGGVQDHLFFELDFTYAHQVYVIPPHLILNIGGTLGTSYLDISPFFQTRFGSFNSASSAIYQIDLSLFSSVSIPLKRLHIDFFGSFAPVALVGRPEYALLTGNGFSDLANNMQLVSLGRYNRTQIGINYRYQLTRALFVFTGFDYSFMRYSEPLEIRYQLLTVHAGLGVTL